MRHQNHTFHISKISEHKITQKPNILTQQIHCKIIMCNFFHKIFELMTFFGTTIYMIVV